VLQCSRRQWYALQ